jgi:predicted neuraminidase
MKKSLLVLVFFSGVLQTGLSGQEQMPHIPAARLITSEMILHNHNFKSCHASTLVELKDGQVLVAWFGGSYEGAGDVRIWGSFRDAGAWTVPFLLADGRKNDSLAYPCWNPVLFRTNAGRLFLFYKAGKNPREWFGFMKSSFDEGVSWSAPAALSEGAIGPVKNKPVELPDGRLLCPSSMETDMAWTVQMELFDPFNGTSEVIPVGNESSFQVIQPAILSYGGNAYRILCRSKSNVLVSSESADRGLTWGQLVATGVPNPNSGIDAVTLTNGTHLLVYNALKAGTEWVQGRNLLNLAWSADGIGWKDILEIENRDSGEFSYPAIIQSADGLIHLTYTHNRTQIRYMKIALD